MERENTIRRDILNILTAAICCLTLYGCSKNENSTSKTTVTILARCKAATVKSAIPDEEKISDINLMIFDCNGMLDQFIRMDDGGCSCQVNLLKGERYTICACANFGYEVKVSSIDLLKGIRYHMAYPDEYKEGIPMYSMAKDILIADETVIRLDLIRLMSKISIKVDRSQLSDGIDMRIMKIKIGNCPKSINIFGESKVSSEDECFPLGFVLDENQCRPLNYSGMGETSDEVSLYLLENMQGDISPEGIHNDTEKVFPTTDIRADICSYIEMEIDYTSDDRCSIETPLIYRFYLGESRNDLNVERNCHYHITVIPQNDGLQGDGWRVDKTGITYTGETILKQYPADYIIGDIGDKIHIGCILTPSDTPFDVGIEYMEDDKNEGIYDYCVDPDGHGALLTLTGPGRGLIYMEAGPPINDAALFLIEVNMPREKVQTNGDTLLYMKSDMKEVSPECQQKQADRHHLQPLGRDQ